MNEFVLDRSDVRIMIWHMALYGLAAIVQDAGIPDVHLSWTGGMEPRARLNGPELSGEVIATAVRDHAAARSHDTWVQADVVINGTARGLMSPRLTPFGDDQELRARVQQLRHRELDQLQERRQWLDLWLLAALGEPSYWSFNRKGDKLPDSGASRLEMQPRNQGSEFVGTRLRKLAEAVAARTPQTVQEGLSGAAIRDEIGKNAVTSSTPTGLTNPGPTDNAVAWCALWGISQFPLAYRVEGAAVTTGHLGTTRSEWFYLPVWQQPWRPARLRTVLAGDQLRTLAAADLRLRRTVSEPQALAVGTWLACRGVVGAVRFPIERFGSDLAPERRARQGERLRTPTT